MTYQHKALAEGGWTRLSFVEQMAHIGSEVIRADRWQTKGNTAYAHLAFGRALELLDLCLTATQPLPRLRELTRLREVIVDYFIGENIYQSTSQLWHSYFLPFTIAARATKEAATRGVEGPTPRS